MPDTYISQFSGEEIDSALRAAQIISGADTPAALREKLEIYGSNTALSPTDPTTVETALKYRSNPNLLDNWYFGRPVNQRGQTEYTAVGYTVDRWKLDIGEAVTLEDGCICLKKSGTYWGEYFDDFNQFIGMTLTGSVLLSDGTLRTGSFVYNGSVNQGQTFFSSELGFYVQALSDSSTQCEINSNVDNVKIKAVKLELGSTQTLAHKEGDKWVLNEIPDFGEQLRRCQRYFVRLTNAYGYGWTYNSSIANFFVSLPTTMRANPVIKLTTNGEIQTINGAKSVTGFEAKGIHPNGFAIDLHNSANALITGTPVTWHSSSMDISADL